MNIKTLLSLVLFPLNFFISCTGGGEQGGQAVLNESTTGIIAQDIIYDVEIKNPDKDDPWMDNALKGLDRETLISYIFQGVYDDHLQAYDIFEGNKISSRKILQMEEDGEFSRDEIGKIQFTEQWTYDSLNHVMSKRVTAVSLGIQNFDPEGYLRGYKPLFKVILP
jgi:hypothetical protein